MVERVVVALENCVGELISAVQVADVHCCPVHTQHEHLFA